MALAPGGASSQPRLMSSRARSIFSQAKLLRNKEAFYSRAEERGDEDLAAAEK